MARLFGREYHKISNVWYFKENIIPFERGELKYHITRNEKGQILLRFYTTSEKKGLFPADLIIIYDDVKGEVIAISCHSCSKTGATNFVAPQEDEKSVGCRHYLSVINYAYNYLSTDIFGSIKTAVYTNKIISYSEQLQSDAINGKILIEGIYDHQMDKVRFIFSDYGSIDLYPISLLAAGKTLPAKYVSQSESISEQMKALSDAEISLLALLQNIKCAHSVVRRVWTLHKSDFVKTFPLLMGLSAKGRVIIKETGEMLIFSDEEFRLTLRVSKLEQIRRERVFTDEDKQSSEAVYILKPFCFYSAIFVERYTYILVENRVYAIRLPFTNDVIEQIFTKGYLCNYNDLVFLATSVAKQLATTGNYIDFDEDVTLPEHVTERPSVILNLNYINDKQDGLGRKKRIRLSCLFDFGTYLLPFNGLVIQSNLIAIEDETDERIWFHIPQDIRQDVIQFFDKLPIPDDDRIIDEGFCDFLSEEKIDNLKKTLYENTLPDWIVNLDDRLKKEFVYKVELKPEIKVEKSDDIDWFEYRVEYRIHDVTFTHEELREFFKRHTKYLKLPDGKMVFFSNKEVYDSIDRQLNFFSGSSYSKGYADRLSRYNLSFLFTLTRYDERIKILGDDYLNMMFSDLLRRKLKRGNDVPLNLYNVMRGYQKAGFRWMKMLQEYRLGGILADDMGLGKTLQAIAILTEYYEGYAVEKQSAKEQNSDFDIHDDANNKEVALESHSKANQKTRPTSIVVCPKTLIFNWANEIEKFHCNLSYIIYEGAKEERSVLLEELNTQIIIVSYAMLSTDIELFNQYHYGYLILDEAQHIKNPSSKRSKAVKKVDAKHRLALTGTPLENNVTELWSIYDFLMPGYMHSYRKFKRLYDNIETDEYNYANQAVTSTDDGSKLTPISIRQMIAPFLLRRKKSDVLLELPDKQEQILHCKMTPQQEKIYLKILAMVRSSLFPKEQTGDQETIPTTKYVHVLAALTRLRQVVNHPGLIKSDLDDKPNVSAKMNLISELVQDAVENRRNILVFSQFSTMLKKIAVTLKELNIIYEYMDGDTHNRQHRIDNFCNNDNVRVFLLTLKVGGLGLNLTKADTVILVDPWWNPMAEQQSIDRAHRIGQTKKVMVYKLITKDTVEEKIIALQERKIGLFNDIIEESSGFIKRLSVEDIKTLFDY